MDVGNAEFGGRGGLDHALTMYSSPTTASSCAASMTLPGMLVERFAGYHRQSYGGCKVGVGDVVIGAAAARRRVQRRGQGQPHQG